MTGPLKRLVESIILELPTNGSDEYVFSSELKGFMYLWKENRRNSRLILFYNDYLGLIVTIVDNGRYNLGNPNLRSILKEYLLTTIDLPFDTLYD